MPYGEVKVFERCYWADLSQKIILEKEVSVICGVSHKRDRKSVV